MVKHRAYSKMASGSMGRWVLAPPLLMLMLGFYSMVSKVQQHMHRHGPWDLLKWLILPNLLMRWSYLVPVSSMHLGSARNSGAFHSISMHILSLHQTRTFVYYVYIYIMLITTLNQLWASPTFGWSINSNHKISQMHQRTEVSIPTYIHTHVCLHRS